ncbi:acetyltransferase [Gottschalkia purinilytica]|uniref:Acetyltransferase n=1 Tax=Gottschalkia purinilytica TaxID=1503 RepID=A0A0L0W8V9_GOTPU|nr:GNAT family N-acetyltransferase [Gottschalkia purinilytica]KNF07891.1 acetyltransferase [Gottschalkia purinilytica]
MRVREAKKEDSRELTKLWKLLSKDHFQKEMYCEQNPNLDDIEDNYIQVLDNKDTFIYVAEENNQLFGFAELVMKEPSDDFYSECYTYILHAFVKEEQRSFPTLIKLYRACEKKTKELGIRYMMTDIYDHNPRVQKLIRYLGMKEYRRRFIRSIEESI